MDQGDNEIDEEKQELAIEAEKETRNKMPFIVTHLGNINGTMILSIMTLSITTLNIMTIRKMPFRTITLTT